MVPNTSPSSTPRVTRTYSQNLRRTGRGCGLRPQLTQYPVVNPVRVEPLHRIDLHTVHLHAEVQMVAAGQARRAAVAHGLALLHHVAHLHIDPAEMPIDRLQAIPVVEHDAVPVDRSEEHTSELQS